MSNSCRHFLSRASAALMAVTAACRKPSTESISTSTFAEAEKLVQLQLTAAEREHGRRQMAQI